MKKKISVHSSKYVIESEKILQLIVTSLWRQIELFSLISLICYRSCSVRKEGWYQNVMKCATSIFPATKAVKTDVYRRDLYYLFILGNYSVSRVRKTALDNLILLQHNQKQARIDYLP